MAAPLPEIVRAYGEIVIGAVKFVANRTHDEFVSLDTLKSFMNAVLEDLILRTDLVDMEVVVDHQRRELSPAPPPLPRLKIDDNAAVVARERLLQRLDEEMDPDEVALHCMELGLECPPPSVQPKASPSPLPPPPPPQLPPPPPPSTAVSPVVVAAERPEVDPDQMTEEDWDALALTDPDFRRFPSHHSQPGLAASHT